MKTTELTKLNPTEFGLTEDKANEIIGGLPQILSEREPMIAQYDEVVLMDIESPEAAKRASEVRKLIKDNRTKGIVPWHKASKEYFLRGGQFVDAVKNREIAISERMEENLEAIEKHHENKEKERKQLLQTQRVESIKQYVENAELLKLSDMDEDVWEAYFVAKKSAYEKLVEEARLAEEARVKKEKEDAEERERIRKDNERLKAEAEAKEKQMEAERKAAAEKLEAERKEAERKLEAERAEAKKEADRVAAEAAAKLKAELEAKAKLEAELKLKKEAEEKAESERKAEELRKQKEAEKLAKAPVKKQLNTWVDSFTLPESQIDHAKRTEISDKFEAFKAWAKKEIDSI